MPRQAPSKRRKFTPEQKAVIVRRHMVDKIPHLRLCCLKVQTSRPGKFALDKSPCDVI